LFPAFHEIWANNLLNEQHPAQVEFFSRKRKLPSSTVLTAALAAMGEPAYVPSSPPADITENACRTTSPSGFPV
jgi:hypothetical protein